MGQYLSLMDYARQILKWDSAQAFCLGHLPNVLGITPYVWTHLTLYQKLSPLRWWRARGLGCRDTGS